MPQIPTAKEGQRLNQNGAGGFQSSGNARMMGEAVADVGRAVASFSATQIKKEKDDPIMRNIWLNKVKAAAQAEAVRLQTDLETKSSAEDMGDKFAPLYEEKMADHKVKVLDGVPEIYKGYADNIYDTTRLTEQAKVFQIAGKQRKIFENNAIDNSLSDTYNKVKIDPTKFKEAEFEAAMLHDTLVQAGKLSPERIPDNRREIGRRLTDSAIDGWVSQPQTEMDVALFGNASKVLEANRSLYKEDEYKKRMDQIETAKNTFLSNTWKLSDRADKVKEKAFTAKQDTNLDEVVSNIYKDKNDPVRMAHHQQTLMNMISQGKANYVRPRAFQALKMADDVQEAAMSSEISAMLGMNPSKEKAKSVFRSLDYMLADDQIDPETHKYWQNYTRNIIDKNKADPNYSKKMTAAMSTIRAAYEVGPMDDLTDMDGTRKKAYLADIAKLQMVASKTSNPDMALDSVRSTWSQKQRSIGAPMNFPFSDLTGNTLRDSDSINKAINYTRDSRNNGDMTDIEFKKRMKEIKQAEDKMKSQERLDSQYYDKWKQGIDKVLPITPLRRD